VKTFLGSERVLVGLRRAFGFGFVKEVLRLGSGALDIVH
jgi:hypothetical protein